MLDFSLFYSEHLASVCFHRDSLVCEHTYVCVLAHLPAEEHKTTIESKMHTREQAGTSPSGW